MASDATGAAPLALVTGGHRRLGAAVSAALAQAGCVLAIHGSHDVELDAALAATLEQCGTQWRGFIADFEEAAEADALIGQVADAFGRAPDVLVNSAALFGQDRLEDVTADALSRHHAVICAAPALLTRHFAALPSDRADGERCIVNILDQRLAQPHGDQLSYTLAKYGLAGLTQISARDLAPRIRVNAVSPGLTLATDDYDASRLERLTGMMPLARLPQPGQVAQAVVYLAQARAVTGQVLCVDGGAHMTGFPRDFMHL